MFSDIPKEYCLKAGDPNYPDYIADCNELSDSQKVEKRHACQVFCEPLKLLFNPTSTLSSSRGSKLSILLPVLWTVEVVRYRWSWFCPFYLGSLTSSDPKPPPPPLKSPWHCYIKIDSASKLLWSSKLEVVTSHCVEINSRHLGFLDF